jgi:hypothetical protein
MNENTNSEEDNESQASKLDEEEAADSKPSASQEAHENPSASSSATDIVGERPSESRDWKERSNRSRARRVNRKVQEKVENVTSSDSNWKERSNKLYASRVRRKEQQKAETTSSDSADDRKQIANPSSKSNRHWMERANSLCASGGKVKQQIETNSTNSSNSDWQERATSRVAQLPLNMKGKAESEDTTDRPVSMRMRRTGSDLDARKEPPGNADDIALASDSTLQQEGNIVQETLPGAYHVQGFRPTSGDNWDDSDLEDDCSTSSQESSGEVGVILQAELYSDEREALGQLRGRVEGIEHDLTDTMADEVSCLQKNRMRLAIGLALVITVAVVCGFTIPVGSDPRPPSAPFASLRTSAPTYTLTLPPTQAPTQFICFDSQPALLTAVDEYLANNRPDTTVASTYGWPIGSWCVSRITDFTSIFSADRNPDALTFDESLSNWDTSQGRIFSSMVSL